MDAAAHFARASNSCKPIAGSGAEDHKTASKIRAQLSNSLGGFRKRQTFACLVFLSSRFHEPIQFPSRLSVLLHLPVPIIIFAWIKQSSQFTTLFRTKLLDRSLDFFHPAHAPSVPVNGISANNSLIRGCMSRSQLRKRSVLAKAFGVYALNYSPPLFGLPTYPAGIKT